MSPLSSPHVQQPAPVLHESNSRPHSLFLWDPFQFYNPNEVQVCMITYFFLFFKPEFCINLLFLLYMLHVPQHPIAPTLKSTKSIATQQHRHAHFSIWTLTFFKFCKLAWWWSVRPELVVSKYVDKYIITTNVVLDCTHKVVFTHNLC